MIEAISHMFVKIVTLSAMASVLALLILAIRYWLKDYLTPAWTFMLWILLIVRLVMPWTPESTISIFNLLPQGETSVQPNPLSATRPVIDYIAEQGMKDSLPTEGPILGTGTEPMPQAMISDDIELKGIDDIISATPLKWTPWNLLVLVWLGGAAVVIGILVREQLRFNARVRQEPEVSSPAIRLLFLACQQELNVQRTVKLIETKQIAVPALLGVIRPKLLLPSVVLHALDTSELRHVFLHELGHLKRRDIPLNLLTSLLLALHWFNPILWYAFRQMKVDQEVACDALVLTHLEQESHRSYALTLLKLLDTLPGRVRVAGAAGISSGKKEMKQRMIMITKHRKMSLKNIVLGLAVITVLSGCTLTGAKLNSASVPEERPSAVPQVDSSVKDSTSLDNKGILLGENNGITLTAKPTAENGLLHEVTVDVRGSVSRTFLWNAITDESRSPIIDEADVNGDGVKEIFIRITTGTGTELYMNDIHVLQPDTLEELEVEDPIEALNQRLKSSITQQNNHTYISAELDGKHLSRVYDYTEGAWWDKIGFGAIISYELKGDQIVARLAGSASMTEFPIEVIVMYGKDLTLESASMYYSAFISPPLSEPDIKSMMEQRLPETGWTFGQDGDQYTVDFPDPLDGEGQGNTYKINPFTGTVYDSTSGSPLSSLVNRDAIDLWEVSNGGEYQKELYKLLQPILDTEGFEPARKEWISGFIGDGYLFGEVRQEGREFTIKADVFTGQWEEIPDPYNS